MATNTQQAQEITLDEYRDQQQQKQHTLAQHKIAEHQHIINKLKNTTYKLRIYPTAMVQVEEVFSITHQELEDWADEYVADWRERGVTYEHLLARYKKECKASSDGGEFNIHNITSEKDIIRSAFADDYRKEYIEEAEWETEAEQQVKKHL